MAVLEVRVMELQWLLDDLRYRAKAEPLTPAQAKELDRRVQAYREDRDPGVPWREALRAIGKEG